MGFPALGPFLGFADNNVIAVRAVRRIAAAEVVALDHALEPTPFRDSDGVHIITGFKEIRPERVAGFYFLGKITELLNPLNRHAIELLYVAKQRLGEPVLFLIVE